MKQEFNQNQNVEIKTCTLSYHFMHSLILIFIVYTHHINIVDINYDFDCTDL